MPPGPELAKALETVATALGSDYRAKPASISWDRPDGMREHLMTGTLTLADVAALVDREDVHLQVFLSPTPRRRPDAGSVRLTFYDHGERGFWIDCHAETAEQILLVLSTLEQALSITPAQQSDPEPPEAAPEAAEPQLSPIAAALAAQLPPAALTYRQAEQDLEDERRLSYRGTANELRECMRETLDHLAPDNRVEQSPGFVLESGQKKPTQRQKVRFILEQRAATGAEVEAALQTVDETAALFRGVYQLGNASAHSERERSAVRRLKAFVDLVLKDVLGLEH